MSFSSGITFPVVFRIIYPLSITSFDILEYFINLVAFLYYGTTTFLINVL